MRASDLRADPINLPFAEKVDALIAEAFGGMHRLRKVEFVQQHHFEIVPHGTLSTFDDDRLTRLVLAAHRYGVRVEIDNYGMRGLKIYLHNRTIRHGGRYFERHPTIEQALESTNESV